MNDSERYQAWKEEKKNREAHAGRWLKRCGEIDQEVNDLGNSEVNKRLTGFEQILRAGGKIILDASKDWREIDRLNRQSHSMQAPFCDNSGVMGNLPDKYLVLSSNDPRERLKQIMREVEYGSYFPD